MRKNISYLALARSQERGIIKMRTGSTYFEEGGEAFRKPAGCPSKRTKLCHDGNDRGYIQYQRELYNVILLINIVISHLCDFIVLTFDGSYDKVQLCHAVAK